jgi:hypothetical protein
VPLLAVSNGLHYDGDCPPAAPARREAVRGPAVAGTRLVTAGWDGKSRLTEPVTG